MEFTGKESEANLNIEKKKDLVDFDFVDTETEKKYKEKGSCFLRTHGW